MGSAPVETSDLPPARVYLFISFDLVNSTIFKQREESWPTVLGTFYRRAEHGINARVAGATVWKYAGDEVLFWVAPSSAEEMCKQLDGAYQVLQELDREMDTTSNRRLRVKGTCWIALAEPESPENLRSPDRPKAPNLIISQPLEANPPTRDFVGPDIDAGFRLGACTFKSTFAVSAELAAVLLDKAPMPIANNLHVVGYKKLKGVWKDRFYPIVWYRKELDNGFEYDDKYENEMLANGIAEKEKKAAKIEELKDAVHSIRTGYVKQLLDAFERPALEMSPTPRLEVHCAAACRRSNGDVLVAQRQADKRIHPEKWEFGCAQLRLGDTFEEALARDYRDDFGAELNFPADAHALATYSFERDGRKIPGVILLAIVTNPEDCKAHKHQNIRWINPSDPPHDVVENAVPDLVKALSRLAS